MSIASLASKVLPFAPLLGSLLGGPAGGAVGALVARTFGVSSDDPAAIGAAIDADPNAGAKLAAMQETNRAELERLALEAETAKLRAVNATMQEELKSDDPYVRRWRPTWGYTTAACWALQSTAIFAAVLGAVFVYPERAGEIMRALGELMANLTIMWGIALSILGVAVHARSKDKATAAGAGPGSGAAAGGIVAGIAGLIRR